MPVHILLTKSEPSPEDELMRGVHDHATVYTITVENNPATATNTVTVDDWLPAGLEFLGCGTVDNTTDAPTFSVSDGSTTAPLVTIERPDPEALKDFIADKRERKREKERKKEENRERKRKKDKRVNCESACLLAYLRHRPG